MKRLAIGVLVGLAVGATGVGAQENELHAAPTPLQAAHSAAAEWLAPLVRPDARRVNVRVAYCRKRGRWHGCRVEVTGNSVCRGVLRVQVRGGTYAAWMPRMRCR